MFRILFTLFYPLTQLRESRKRYGATKFLTELVVLNMATPFILLSLALLKNTFIGNKYVGVIYVSIVAFMVIYWVDASIGKNRQELIESARNNDRLLRMIILGIIIVFVSILILASGVWLIASWYWN